MCHLAVDIPVGITRPSEAAMRRNTSLNRNFLCNAEPVVEGFSVPVVQCFEVSLVTEQEAALETFLCKHYE